MFCQKCGNEIKEKARFCHKCGAEIIIDEPIYQTCVSSASTSIQLQPCSLADSVELVVTCMKIKGFFPGSVFSVLVDDMQMGELLNGGVFTCRITPGQHCVKIGRTSIRIDIPEGTTSVTLNLQYEQNNKLEIICDPGHLVTEPSKIEQITFQSMIKEMNACVIIGLVFAVLGFASFVGSMTINSYYYFYSLPLFIGGLVLVAAGGVFLILSPKTKKMKLKMLVLGLVLAVAVGAIVNIAVTIAEIVGA